MRYIITMLVSGMLCLLCSCAEIPNQGKYKYGKTNSTSYHKNVKKQPLLARITVYWAKGKGSDRYTRRYKSSTGKRLRKGYCAVDPKKIPYGSKIVYPDNSFDIAMDTGRDVINRKAARRAGRNLIEKSAIVIDKFFDTKREALAWATPRPMFLAVQIIPPVITKSEDDEENEWKR